MISPLLESITQKLNYNDLPETWQVPEITRFSNEKTLHEYQEDALKKTAKALYQYYEKEYNWIKNEQSEVNIDRKRYFIDLYSSFPTPNIRKYETTQKKQLDEQYSIFRILAEYMEPQNEVIPYDHLINRMCFWMATGSGKTLVMVKLIEYLHSLIKHQEIPPYKILILAPKDYLIEQIRKTIEEFNQAGLHINFVPLRESQHNRQAHIGETITVYYHRSDNISDVQKDALTDYRAYENGGQWYVLLDEAHKGGKEDSKRQAYYAVMARNGFLFNFSATFTDEEDIATTVKKYNLEEFIKNGYGKNIYLSEREYSAFINRDREINHKERQKIVLKSLITLTYVSHCVEGLRKSTGIAELYHLPLMLTLVNSVNTDVENERNDLWAFFQTLREIATNEIDSTLFNESKNELIDDWENTPFNFGESGKRFIEFDKALIKKMTKASLRKAVFLSQRKGALQFINSNDNKELALQMKNADKPFALIRIGTTSRWRNELLVGYERTDALQEKSFFDQLNQSSITILMGSRSFFESWDSNRPNVINFINIGTRDAKKFVMQSIGRGVRIEPLPDRRQRLKSLLPTLSTEERSNLSNILEQGQLLETLFLFATNRSAIELVLAGLETSKTNEFHQLKGFEKAEVCKLDEKEMPLLIPKYRESNEASECAPFSMSKETLKRFQNWIARTSDSVFTVRDELDMPQINALRQISANKAEEIRSDSNKDYSMLSFLQQRLISHLSQRLQIPEGVKKINDEDIIHFRNIKVNVGYANDIQKKINKVMIGKPSDTEIRELAERFGKDEMTREEFDKKVSGSNEESFKDLQIKNLLNHYYIPIILGTEKSDYIQHIIKIKSEIDFLNDLEVWVNTHKAPWDAWMFSKIDESLDNIHIPYYDSVNNNYRKYFPDFIFWMCKGNEYRIVFVDPKGTAHTSSYCKIDGYRKLFESLKKVRKFKFKHSSQQLQVSVHLLFYNPSPSLLDEYTDHWINNIASIFEV